MCFQEKASMIKWLTLTHSNLKSVIIRKCLRQFRTTYLVMSLVKKAVIILVKIFDTQLNLKNITLNQVYLPVWKAKNFLMLR